MIAGFQIADCCINCKHCRVLKHNPILEDGEDIYSETNCCVYYAQEEENGYVKQVSPSENCGHFTIKE